MVSILDYWGALQAIGHELGLFVNHAAKYTGQDGGRRLREDVEDEIARRGLRLEDFAKVYSVHHALLAQFREGAGQDEEFISSLHSDIEDLVDRCRRMLEAGEALPEHVANITFVKQMLEMADATLEMVLGDIEKEYQKMVGG